MQAGDTVFEVFQQYQGPRFRKRGFSFLYLSLNQLIYRRPRIWHQGADAMTTQFLRCAIRTALLVAISCLFFSRIDAHAQSPVERDIFARAYTAAHKGDYSKFAAIDAELFALLGRRGTRNGGAITLTMEDGAAKTYTDAPECKDVEKEAECITYFLVTVLSEQKIFIVAKWYYEWLEYLVIDSRTGQETVVQDFPSFAPSGQIMLVLRDGGADDPAVEIWKRSDHSYSLEWSDAPYSRDAHAVEYSLIDWSAEDLIQVQSKVDEGIYGRIGYVKTFSMQRTAAGWALVEQSQ